jgi:hypothetical protein
MFNIGESGVKNPSTAASAATTDVTQLVLDIFERFVRGVKQEVQRFTLHYWVFSAEVANLMSICWQASRVVADSGN